MIEELAPPIEAPDPVNTKMAYDQVHALQNLIVFGMDQKFTHKLPPALDEFQKTLNVTIGGVEIEGTYLEFESNISLHHIHLSHPDFYVSYYTDGEGEVNIMNPIAAAQWLLDHKRITLACIFEALFESAAA
jgi:hypothetical protein